MDFGGETSRVGSNVTKRMANEILGRVWHNVSRHFMAFSIARTAMAELSNTVSHKFKFLPQLVLVFFVYFNVVRRRRKRELTFGKALFGRSQRGRYCFLGGDL